MIIKSADEALTYKSSVIDGLWPVSDECAEGELVVGERTYDVAITREEGTMTKARVRIASSIPDKDAIEHAALECAQRGLADPAWEPLVVDPNDGETVYATTMTVNPSSEALDRFFIQARDFLLAHGDEVDAIIACDEDSYASKREAAMSRFLDRLIG